MHINSIGNGNGPNGPGGITPPSDSNPEPGNLNNKISHIIQNLLNDLRENGYSDSTNQAFVPISGLQSNTKDPEPTLHSNAISDEHNKIKINKDQRKIIRCCQSLIRKIR